MLRKVQIKDLEELELAGIQRRVVQIKAIEKK